MCVVADKSFLSGGWLVTLETTSSKQQWS